MIEDVGGLAGQGRVKKPERVRPPHPTRRDPPPVGELWTGDDATASPLHGPVVYPRFGQARQLLEGQ